MRELRYEHKGANAYLVYTVGEEDVIDSLSLGMLTNNEIEGIIPTQFSQMDDTKQFLFNVSGKVSAAQLFKGPINKKRLVSILSGAVAALLSAEEYMLEPQSILLGLDYIYVDMKTSETAVICLPLENAFSNTQNLKGFFKDIIYQAQFDQAEGYDHVAQILNFINSSADLSLNRFKALLASLSGEAKKTEHPHPPVHGGSHGSHGTGGGSSHIDKIDPWSPPGDDAAEEKPDAHDDDQKSDEPEISLYELLTKFNAERYEKYKAQQKKKKDSKKDKASSKPEKKEKHKDSDVDLGFAIPGQEESIAPARAAEPVFAPEQKMEEPETEVADSGDTELLVYEEPNREQAYLVYLKTGEKVFIEGSRFVIGKKRGEVDYCIADNKTVSRVHAMITSHNGEYFVVDLESKNYTYINGVKIPAKEEVILAHGTRLSFSDEEFEFCLV